VWPRTAPSVEEGYAVRGGGVTVTFLLHIYDVLIETVVAVMFAGMAVILMGQVIARYFFQFPFMWAEEVGIYLFIWIVYLGSAIAYKRRSHLLVDFLVNYLPSAPKRSLELFLHLVVMAFLFVFVFLPGLKYAGMNLDVSAFSVSQIRMGWVYASVPVGACAMLINMLRIIPDMLKPASAR
jgi:TRAP-type C4-dicarboxylate transport system permease small subunit